MWAMIKNVRLLCPTRHFSWGGGGGGGCQDTSISVLLVPYSYLLIGIVGNCMLIMYIY